MSDASRDHEVTTWLRAGTTAYAAMMRQIAAARMEHTKHYGNLPGALVLHPLDLEVLVARRDISEELRIFGLPVLESTAVPRGIVWTAGDPL